MNKIDVAHARLNSIAADDHLGHLEAFFDLMIAEAEDALRQRVIQDEKERPALEEAALEMKFARQHLMSQLRQSETNGNAGLAWRVFRAVNAVHHIGMIGNASRSAMAHGDSKAQTDRASGSRDLKWHKKAREVASKKLGQNPEIKNSDIYRAIRRAKIPGASDEEKTLSRVIGVLPEIAARKIARKKKAT